MRILLLNPNTSQSITTLLDNAARPAIAHGTHLTSMTAPRGVPYIASRAEAAIAAVQVLELLAEHHTSFDAAIIAAFADPGLGPARELFPIPIIGLAEAGMLTACMLGGRFGIVTFTPALEAWYYECIAWHRLEPRCAGVFALDEAFTDIAKVQDDKAEALVQLAARAIASGADTIVLWPFFGGGPMGKPPVELAQLENIICTRIACHPIDEVVAAGYTDGSVLIAEIATKRVLRIAAAEHGPISALAWSPNGQHLAFGTEQGFAALLDFKRSVGETHAPQTPP